MQREIERHQQKIDDYDDLWEKTVPKMSTNDRADDDHVGQLEEPEENLLYFIEKNAPTLPIWKREIIRIVRRLATYWYPQSLTGVVNEGYATFTHHYIMNRLYERGLIDEGSFIEFIANHTGVITQHDYDSKYYSGFNVYTVGFNIFRDLKRMCEHPTDEDREWFPDIVGKRWQDVINNAMKNYNNETFINQFLSPKVMRDMKLFAVLDSYREKDYVVSGIHDEQGYRTVREIFARQYNRSRHVPDIAVVAADMNGTRELVLFHNDINDVPLDERSATQVLQYVAELWEYDVRLETISLSSRGAANKDIIVKGPNSEISKLRVSPRDPYFSPETD
jgi:spore cortex formation protein SpoVR/YcgB (stage V sporulation)